MNTDESQPQPLIEQPWFVTFLESKGFSRSSPDTFTRGKGSLHVQGTTFSADPGDEGKTWNGDFNDAEPSTIKVIIEQVIKMRPFLTEADLAAERAEKIRLERALTGIAATIKEGPDTGSGVQLRRFLWSLYNSHHLVNLWRMTSALDSRRSAWVSEVFAGAFVGVLKEDDIKRALLAAGEMERWDKVALSEEGNADLDEALRRIESLLRGLPPSRTHTELKAARDCLLEAQEALRRAKEPTPTE